MVGGVQAGLERYQGSEFGFAEYKAAVESAPKRTLENRERLSTLPPAEQAAEITTAGSSAEIRKELEARQETLRTLSDDLERVAGELLKTAARPIRIGSRLPEAQRELSAR